MRFISPRTWRRAASASAADLASDSDRPAAFAAAAALAARIAGGTYLPAESAGVAARDSPRGGSSESGPSPSRSDADSPSARSPSEPSSSESESAPRLNGSSSSSSSESSSSASESAPRPNGSSSSSSAANAVISSSSSDSSLSMASLREAFAARVLAAADALSAASESDSPRPRLRGSSSSSRSSTPGRASMKSPRPSSGPFERPLSFFSRRFCSASSRRKASSVAVLMRCSGVSLTGFSEPGCSSGSRRRRDFFSSDAPRAGRPRRSSSRSAAPRAAEGWSRALLRRVREVLATRAAVGVGAGVAPRAAAPDATAAAAAGVAFPDARFAGAPRLPLRLVALLRRLARLFAVEHRPAAAATASSAASAATPGSLPPAGVALGEAGIAPLRRFQLVAHPAGERRTVVPKRSPAPAATATAASSAEATHPRHARDRTDASRESLWRRAQRGRCRPCVGTYQ